MIKKIISIALTTIVLTLTFLLFGCEDKSYFSFITDQTTKVFTKKSIITTQKQRTSETSSTLLIIVPITDPVTTKKSVATNPVTTTRSATTSKPETMLPPVTTFVATTTVSQSTLTSPSTEAQIVATPITVTQSPGDVKRGGKATISIKGMPNTLYSIKVKYSSGYSSAKGLVDTMSDGEGNCSWSWRIGAKTPPGEYDIIISDGTNNYIIKFEVI